MRKLLAGLILALASVSPALAQTKFTMPPPAGVFVMGMQVVSSCGAASGLAANNVAYATMDTTGTICTGSGGGGGGLSVLDGAAFTAGTSHFTPSGCEYNSTIANLTSGTQGTVRCSTERAFIIDTDTTNNNLYNLINSPPPLSVNGANGAWSGLTPGTAQTGTIVAANTDQTSLGGVAYGAMANYGTSPGAVKVPGNNSFITGCTPCVSTFTHAQSSVLASNLVAKSAAGTLASFEVSADSTLSAAAWWVLIFDATSLPSNGTVTPAKCYAVPSGTTLYSAGFPTPGIAMTSGITLGVSTTGCFTLTASVHAFIAADYQ